MATQNTTKFLWLVLLAVLLTPPTHHVSAQTGAGKLSAANGAANDQFGASVAFDGNTVVIGACGYDANGNAEQGTAYVFVRMLGVWTLQQQLSAPDGAAGDQFGWSVALSGDTALIGAIGSGANPQQGAAYVFTRTNTVWTLQQKLTASDGAANDAFGWAVALNGDTALVGAIGKADANPNQGAAYVFTRTGIVWTQQQKLTASDGAAQAAFGSAVALDGNTALIGAPDDDNNNQTLRGAAYIFTRSGTAWTQQQKLTANDGAPNDNFGRAVALSGDTALCGAPGSNVSRGAAYAFTRSGTTWTQQQKLTANDGAALDAFGASVSLNASLTATRALIGAPGVQETQGAAYSFTRGGAVWTQQQKHTTTDGAAGDSFGQTLAQSGDQMLLGAPGCDLNAKVDQGAAYLVDLCPAISLGPDALNITTLGAPVSVQLTASGGAAPYSFALASGALPSGLMLSANGLLSGTPNSGGTFTFSVRAQDANGCAGVRAWTVTLGCTALTLTPATLPSTAVGAAFSQMLTATGGTAPYTFSLNAGAPPNGVTLASNGLLSGTPALYGSFTFTVRALDGFGCAGTQTYTLTVNCPALTLTPATLPEAKQHRAFTTVNFGLSGGLGQTTVALSGGALPAGLTLASGALSGTPRQPGVFNFSLRGTDEAGCATTRAYTLTVRSTVVRADFDRDGKTDFSVWTGPSGNWQILNSADNTTQNIAWGTSNAPFNDVIVPGDYDGDGKTDLAIWRGGSSVWFIRQSSDGQPRVQLFGTSNAPYFDVATPGDYDGDGKTDLAVWRPATGTFFVLKSSDGNYLVETLGGNGDRPVVADYDGDGISDFAVWTPQTGNWQIKRSGGGVQTIQWGAGAAPYFDTPVPADYDGDGKADLAIWRGSDSTWYIRRSSDLQATVQQLGTSNAPYFDVPVPGDFDGDGKADIAVWRPATGTWFVLRSSTGTYLFQVFGQNGDMPVPVR